MVLLVSSEDASFSRVGARTSDDENKLSSEDCQISDHGKSTFGKGQKKLRAEIVRFRSMYAEIGFIQN